MTTQEIANRYYELAQRGQYEQMQDELYTPSLERYPHVRDFGTNQRTTVLC